MKRLVALLTAVLFIISACVFAGCGNGDAKTPIEKEKVDLSTLSNAELLALSFADSFAQDNALTVLLDKATEPKDSVIGTKLEVNKLVADGENLLEDPLSIEFEGKMDYGTDFINGIAAELKVSMLGETLPLEFIANGDGIYATDILGLNDKAIGISTAEIEAMIESMGGLEGILGSLDPYGAYENATYWEDATAIGIIGGAESNDFDYGYANSFPTDFDAIIDSALESVIGENYKDVVGDDFDVLYDLDYEALINGDIQGFLEGIMNDQATSEAITAMLDSVFTPFFDAFASSIEANVTEDLLTKEVKNVTVEGVEFKNAYVISLYVEANLLKEIIETAYEKLLYGENLYGAALGNAQLNFDDILQTTEGISLTVTNVLSAEGEAISRDIYLTGMGQAAKYVSTDIGTKSTFKVGMVDANGNFDANLGYIYYNYDWNKDNNTEKGVLGATMGGANEEYAKFEGSYNGDKHEGRFSIGLNDELFGVDYMIKGDDLCGEISVGNFAFNENGRTETLNVTFTMSYNIYVEGVEVEFGIKGEIEGTEADMTISFWSKNKDVTINAPKDYQKLSEMNEMVFLGWFGDFSEKYPNISKALMGDFGGMSGLGGGYNDDYSFDLDDYSFDLDDYSFDLDDYSFDLDDYSFDLDDYSFDFDF
ncbi:MAG: hypothetical protein IKU23_03840 [Clostridia bacterium]|nr:hypothetical protein [Clostridia bacterium]